MATKEEKKGSSNAWQWFLGGVVVGILLSGFVYAKWLMKPSVESAEPQNVSQSVEKDNKPVKTKIEEKKPEPEKKPVEKTTEKTTGTQFEFYEKLPKDQAIRTPAPPPANKTEQKAEETKTPPAGNLMLQVASTVDKKAGEEMLADLKELGFQGDIQEATVGGKVRYRIRVGPYISGQIPEAQQKLKANGFEGIIAKP
jgi:cell division protein FtsN